MRELNFGIDTYLGGNHGSAADRATLAALRITAGPEGIPITEVWDTIAQTVRPFINIPAHAVARWFVVNWWRLRWEPQLSRSTPEWRNAHSMAGISGDYAWPAIEFSSDGEFVQVQLAAESAPDVSAVRCLRDLTLDIPAQDFEDAVDDLVERVGSRLSAFGAVSSELQELCDELRAERRNPQTARACKLQALAGIDPGTVSPQWLEATLRLSERVGVDAADEIVASLPGVVGGLDAAERALDAMRSSTTSIQLDWIARETSRARGRELPWEKGVRLAGAFRQQHGLGAGPLGDETLGRILDVKMPLQKPTWDGAVSLLGGFRNGNADGRTSILVVNRRNDSQRFYLARLIASAHQTCADQHVLPVTGAYTAQQKFERSFAQELLCPWVDLKEFVAENGADEDGIATAAQQFGVSELLVQATLVNRKALPHGRLVGE